MSLAPSSFKPYLILSLSLLLIIGAVFGFASSFFRIGNNDLFLKSNSKTINLKTAIEDLKFPAYYTEPLNIFNNTFSIQPLKAQASQGFTEKNNQAIRYIDAYTNTDVVKTKYSSMLKEDILLKQPGHPEQFSFQIDTDTYDFEKNQNGDFVFYSKGKKGDELAKLFTIPAPYMFDADKKKSALSDVTSDLTTEGRLTIKPNQEWLNKAKYPVTLDPTIEINIINIHSHPQQGDNWTVDFTTQGKADLKIIPNDQATIDDDEFVSLSCGDQVMNPEILAGDVISYPNWSCDKTATVIHNTKKAGNHTLRFEFGDQRAYAYNSSTTIDLMEYSFDSAAQTAYVSSSSPSDFGTGVDGAATISTNTSLGSDKNYSDLTINSGITLNTAGYIVRCTGTLTNNGIITSNTAHASAGQSGGTGGTGGGAAYTDGGSANGGSGGSGGGRVRIYAAALINNGIVHANGGSAGGATAGGTGGVGPWQNFIGWWEVQGGGGGGGGGGNGGAGGSVELTYSTRTQGTVTANGGAGSSGGAGGAGGTAGCTPASQTNYYGSSGGIRAGTGGHGTLAGSVDQATAGTAGTAGSAGSAGSVTWTQSLSALASYSESTIKTQGTYALKGVATITTSLNKTLTRTIASPLDLTGVNSFNFDIRSTRTGSNIKIGIHDTGGTTTEITPNITNAGAYQTVTWDISGVSNANKDAIDKIVITIVNADAANTFYIDNMTIVNSLIIMRQNVSFKTGLFGAQSNVDLMEYSSDSAAQTAYVTSGVTAIDVGPAVTDRSYSGGGYGYTNLAIENPANATGVLTSFELWFQNNATGVKMGTFSGSAGTFTMRDYESIGSVTGGLKQTFTGKNCDVATGDLLGWYSPTGQIEVDTTGGSGYYYKPDADYFDGSSHSYPSTTGTMSTYATGISGLQSYSESTTKTQGSYSLKGVAGMTSALNKTLTRTIASPLDLTNRNTLSFDIRASRIGSNIKIGIHDSGGTTTEITPNITVADSFQTANIDLSGVSNANKDAIDQIIITITNADTSNIFYLDNMTVSQRTDYNSGSAIIFK